MPPHQQSMATQGLPSAGEIIRDIPVVLRESFTARFAALGLSSVILTLILAQMISPGYTKYWWYQLAQTTATLVIVLVFNAAFASEGGMAIQTHIVVIAATLADTIGTTFGFYQTWEPYDKIVHFTSGAAFAAGVFQALNFLSRRGVLSWSAVRRGLASFSASVLVCGFIWETYEYMGDAVFNSGRVQSRGDTVGDLIADTAGALVAVAVIFEYERRLYRKQQKHAAQSHFAALPEPDPTPLHPAFSKSSERDYVMSRGHASMDD
jgi:hypothetical protein